MSERNNHTGPVIFADETARTQLEQHGDVVTFRTSDRTTGKTWWRKSRTGKKMGDCEITHMGTVDPSRKDELRPHRIASGFRNVAEWQEAIRELNGELSEGHLYRVTSGERWSECEECHDYSTDVKAFTTQPPEYTFLCPECAGVE